VVIGLTILALLFVSFDLRNAVDVAPGLLIRKVSLD
jgi:hypothetical protein